MNTLKKIPQKRILKGILPLSKNYINPYKLKNIISIDKKYYLREQRHKYVFK